MNKLTALLRAHINEDERAKLAQKNGRDPAVPSSPLERLLGQANSRGGQDDIVAELTPKDARMLKKQGGSGRIDPVTKDVHFDDDGDGSGANDSATGSNSGTGDGYGDNTSSDFTSDPDTSSMPGSLGTDAFGGSNPDASAPGIGSPSDSVSGVDNEGRGANAIAGRNDTAFGPSTPGYAGTTNSAEYSYDPNTGWTSAPAGQANTGYSWGAENAPGPTTTVSQAYNQALSALGLDGASRGVAGQSINSLASPSTVSHEAPTDENSMYGWGPSAFSTGTAAQAGNAVATNNAGLGGRGDTFENVTQSYENSPFSWNAENNMGGGFGGYANQALQEGKDFMNAHPGITNAVNLGLTAINPTLGLVSSALTNAGRGNYGNALSTLGGLLGGPAVGQGLGLASNVLGGTPGNIVGGALNSYANSLSPGLGTALGVSGITGLGANALNQGYQEALTQAMNDTNDPGNAGNIGSADSIASADAASSPSAIMGTLSIPDMASGSVFAPSYGPGGGGSNDSGSLGEDFVGSKKKSRYLQNQLMALLGGQNAD